MNNTTALAKRELEFSAQRPIHEVSCGRNIESPFKISDENLKIYEKIKYKVFDCRHVFFSGLVAKDHFKGLNKISKFLEITKEIIFNRKEILEKAAVLIFEGHYSKKNPNLNLSYSITKIKNSIFVHVPKSEIQHGTEKKIKLAIEIKTGELVAYGKMMQLRDQFEMEQLVNHLCGHNPSLKKNYAFGFYTTRKLQYIYQIFMKLYTKGDAFNRCTVKDDQEKISAKQMLNWFLSVASGIKEMHDKRLTHNDVKAENMLLTDDGESLVLTDFSCANDWRAKDRDKCSIEMGTSTSMAPERIKERVVNFEQHKKGDIYSFGAFMYILMNGTFLPWQVSEFEALRLRHRTQVDFDKFFPEPIDKKSIEHLCWKMLQYDMDKRPTIEKVIAELESFILSAEKDFRRFPIGDFHIPFMNSNSI